MGGKTIFGLEPGLIHYPILSGSILRLSVAITVVEKYQRYMVDAVTPVQIVGINMDKTSLGDRMKDYERVSRTKLVRRTPVILRVVSGRNLMLVSLIYQKKK